MIGFLRLAGIFNAAVWFGAAVFLVLGANPATHSDAMKSLLGANNFPFFSVAIGQLIAGWFFRLSGVCAVVAVLHVMAEWLYLGKVPGRLWRGLLVLLVAGSLLNGLWVLPKTRHWNAARFAANTAAEKRESARRSFSAWQVVSQSINLLLVAGLAVYLWRMANPPDPARFVSAVKFRS